MLIIVAIRDSPKVSSLAKFSLVTSSKGSPTMTCKLFQLFKIKGVQLRCIILDHQRSYRSLHNLCSSLPAVGSWSKFKPSPHRRWRGRKESENLTGGRGHKSLESRFWSERDISPVITTYMRKNKHETFSPSPWPNWVWGGGMSGGLFVLLFKYVGHLN